MEPKVGTIVLDEKHRFLLGQPSHRECAEWSTDFTRAGLEHIVAKIPDNSKDEWTIYKHMFSIDNRYQVVYCCDTFRQQGGEVYEEAAKRLQAKWERENYETEG